MGKHVRIKGGQKKVNDFLRVIIGKSSYGDPTEKDMTTPQIDKMLNKSMKESVNEEMSDIYNKSLKCSKQKTTQKLRVSIN